MPCAPFHNGIFCYSPRYRLRLLDGRYIWMDWHSYLGPTFFRDREMKREIKDWWDDPNIGHALDWFIGRGCKA
jgi:hypothetical protein